MSRREQEYLGSSDGKSQPPIDGGCKADDLSPSARYPISLTVQLSLQEITQSAFYSSFKNILIRQMAKIKHLT